MTSTAQNYEASVIQYFKDKAEDYDRVDEQVYWRLSDSLLWELLDREVLSKLPASFAFLDAGGGTGRWSEKVLEAYTESSGHLRDLSRDMLRQAAKRQDRFETRLEISQGRLEELDEISTGTFDLVFNFHNVLGFVDDPQQALSELSRVLKPGGYLVTVAPNYYHMIFFNLSCGRIAEAKRVAETRKGTFVAGMPALRVFAPTELEALYRTAGIQPVFQSGFPVTVYPGYQETQLDGSTQSLTDSLGSAAQFDTVRSLELNLLQQNPRELASRGNNLIIAGIKE